MKIYMTQYALTKGVLLLDGERSLDNDTMVKIISKGWLMYVVKGEWFEDWPSALANAEQRRAKGIAAAERKLTRLQHMTFTEPTEPTEYQEVKP